ncbi:MAG: DMT family transporter [Bacteroidota bacterium]
MAQRSTSYWQDLAIFNLAMLLIGSSGAWGRTLTIPPPLTIWWRSFLALFFLGAYCWYAGFSFRVTGRRSRWLLLLAGVLFAGHLVAYFYALQWANLAIAILSVFTFPAMTTLLEPLLLKKPFEGVHLILAVLMMIGVYFLAPSFDLSNDLTAGLAMGLLSAFVFALRNILLKTQVDAIHGSVLMFHQMVVIVLILVPVLFIYPPLPPADEFPALIALGLFTTTIGHSLFLMSFRRFSVSTASLMSSTQPIYGILLGVIFLGEIPGWRSLIGGIIIISTFVIEALRVRTK